MTTRSPIPGMKLLLMGAPGSGKTSAIRSWLSGTSVLGASRDYSASGLTAFGLFTESSFDVVGDIPCPQLHWVHVPPVLEGWTEMLDTMTKVNTFAKKTLAGMEWPGRTRYQKILDVVRTLNKFVCQRCGQDFGDVAQWGTNRVLVVDSLSGLNAMFLQMVVGGNPMKDIGEWGIAIEQEEKFVQTLCENLHCHVQLSCHLDRETDMVEGKARIVPAALGNKLPTRIGRHFTDIIYAQQQGGKFTWSTTAGGAELKARNLPLGDSLAPDVGPMLAAWKSRGGIIEQDSDK